MCRNLLSHVGATSAVVVVLLFLFSSSALAQGFVDPDIAGNVYDVALQPDGKILIAGTFATVAGQPRSRVARLNSNGSLDTSFQDPQTSGSDPFNNYVSSLALQPDGKILIGGIFVTVGGQFQNYLARLNADGSLDTSFSPQLGNSVTAITLQADGKILIAGYFTTINGISRGRMARLNSDGSLDSSFQDPNLIYPGPSGASVGTIVVQPDGKILIGGYFTSVAGQSRQFGARLNSDGTLDTGFGLSVTGGPVSQVVMQPYGKILLCGFFSQVNGSPQIALARVNTDGSLDDTLQNVAIPSGNITAVGLQSDGKLVVGGDFSG